MIKDTDMIKDTAIPATTGEQALHGPWLCCSSSCLKAPFSSFTPMNVRRRVVHSTSRGWGGRPEGDMPDHTYGARPKPQRTPSTTPHHATPRPTTPRQATARHTTPRQNPQQDTNGTQVLSSPLTAGPPHRRTGYQPLHSTHQTPSQSWRHTTHRTTVPHHTPRLRVD
jgi:hypothetical protein